MKAKELMIGDWVLYNGNIFIEDEYEPSVPIQPEQIESGEDIDLAINGCYSPIPITPEILEKNGFKIDGEYSECIADGLFVNVLIWAYEAEDIYISWDDNDNALSIAYNLGKPCDEIKLIEPKVHELQHALRLCGLSELANNFIV